MPSVNWTSRRAVPALLVAAIAVPIVAVGWLAWSVIGQDRVIERSVGTMPCGARPPGSPWRSKVPWQRWKSSSFPITTLDSTQTVRIPERSVACCIGRNHERSRQACRTSSLRLRRSSSSERSGRRCGGVPTTRALASFAGRAAALVRLGALYRKQGDRPAALRVYDELQRLGSIDVDGQPAELIARQARCRLFEMSGDRPQLQQETAELARVLYSGRMSIDQTTFAFYASLLKDWGARRRRSPRPTGQTRHWTCGGCGRPVRFRRVAGVSCGRPISRPGDLDNRAGWDVRAVPPSERARADLFGAVEGAAPERFPPGPGWQPPSWAGGAGRGGPVARGNASAVRHSRRLRDWREDGEVTGRRWLFAIGLTLTVGLMLAAAYGLSRATAKEMALMRQQSDFVSAVSHEFRTPLTSMRHLTELLATNSVQDETRKATYYHLLARETERLHRMVENLLNYNRIQAGAYAWRLEPVRVDELVRTVAEDFGNDSRAWQGHRLPIRDQDLPALTLTVTRWAGRSPISWKMRPSIRVPGHRSRPRRDGRYGRGNRGRRSAESGFRGRNSGVCSIALSAAHRPRVPVSAASGSASLW